jgi:Ala-tRNA(Pro) deacylase
MDIYEFLHEHGLHYDRYDHEPVYTCGQADMLDIRSPAAKTKNLFLRDRKGRRHFLVTVGAEKTVDIKALETVLDVKGLSFGSAERLMAHLGITPGAVTILAAFNDREGKVEVIVDEALWKNDSIQCHPLLNTSTIILSRQDIERFLILIKHPPRIMVVPGRE